MFMGSYGPRGRSSETHEKPPIQVTITSSIRFRNRSKCTNAGNNYIIIQLKCKIHYLRLQTQDSRSRPWPWALLAVVLIRILAEVLRSHGLAIRLCLFLLDVGSGFIILCCVFPLFWGFRMLWSSDSVWLPFSVPKSGWFSLFWLASFFALRNRPRWKLLIDRPDPQIYVNIS